MKHAKVHGALYFQGFHDFFTMQIFGPRNDLQDVPQGQREPAQRSAQSAQSSAAVGLVEVPERLGVEGVALGLDVRGDLKIELFYLP